MRIRRRRQLRAVPRRGRRARAQADADRPPPAVDAAAPLLGETGVAATPGEGRPDTHQEEQGEEDGYCHSVEVGLTTLTFTPRTDSAKIRENGADQDGEHQSNEEKIIEEEGSFPGEQTVASGLADQGIDAQGQKSNDEDEKAAEKYEKSGSDWALGEGVDRVDDSGTGQEGAEDGEYEDSSNEHNGPCLERSASLKNDGRVECCDRREPRQEGCILDGVPGPVASPAENFVGPPSAQHDTCRKKGCWDQEPVAKRH